MKIQTIWMPKMIWAKYLSQEAGPFEPFLSKACFIIKYELNIINSHSRREKNEIFYACTRLDV